MQIVKMTKVRKQWVFKAQKVCKKIRKANFEGKSSFHPSQDVIHLSRV